jgi:DNA-binding transcriptional MerR regulator
MTHAHAITPPGSRGSSGARLTIGKVLAALRGEFPDISPSKVRFLEAEGLIEPERTASGYRTYTAADVARLRYILIAQRDRYWPLKVIRDALDAIDRGLPDPAGAHDGLSRLPEPVPDPEVPSAERLLDRRAMALTGPELRQAAGLDKETFHALQTFGLLQTTSSGYFDEHDLAVAAAARTLSAHGLEARHLRAFRTAADREIGLVQHALASSRDEAREARAAEILSACVRLHAALVKAGLER